MARYTEQTKQAILDRMIAASRQDVDRRQGSVTWDMLSPASIEIALAYTELDKVLEFGFADTTYGEYLDMRAGEYGVTRKQATKAIGYVTFSGDDGTVVALRTRVSTDAVEPIYFVTTVEGVIANGTVTLPVEAEQAGSQGNVASGQVQLVVGDLVGVTAVTNESPFDGGTNRETDVDLLERYLDKVRRPATSGNVYHYSQWAKSVNGVGDAKVYPIWNGNGTVKVVLLGDDNTPATQDVVDNTYEYIETVRPIGATVTVVPATARNIDISANLTLRTDATLTQAKLEIEDAVREYLAGLAFLDPIVRYSQIASIVLSSPSVLDYANLTMSGGTGNVEVADGEVAVVGTVNVT